MKIKSNYVISIIDEQVDNANNRLKEMYEAKIAFEKATELMKRQVRRNIWFNRRRY